MSDLTSATALKTQLEAELERAEAQLRRVEEELGKFASPASSRRAVEEAVGQVLQEVNTKFGAGEAEARRVEIRYRFDREAAEDDAVEWLVDDIRRVIPHARPRSDHAKTTLEKAGPVLATTSEDILTAVKADESKTAEILDLYFARPPRMDIWQTKCAGVLGDVGNYMRLDILYDGKRLEQTSFGQRCSAVLMVLLSLGNRPIIVDEPEAHLDSATIANFMVDLVKEVKSHRQIVFATHNANFVVNGDAELVHVLSPDNEGRSILRSTTIEDLEARPAILALEGGERAFRQREGRYGLDP